MSKEPSILYFNLKMLKLSKSAWQMGLDLIFICGGQRVKVTIDAQLEQMIVDMQDKPLCQY
jgi:hypothetical protein